MARRRDASQAAQREFLDALQKEQVCLAGVSLPAGLRTQHGVYVQLLGKYRDAVAACNEAIEGGRPDEVEHAAEEVCDLWQAVDDMHFRLAGAARGDPSPAAG